MVPNSWPLTGSVPTKAMHRPMLAAMTLLRHPSYCVRHSLCAALLVEMMLRRSPMPEDQRMSTVAGALAMNAAMRDLQDALSLATYFGSAVNNFGVQLLPTKPGALVLVADRLQEGRHQFGLRAARIDQIALAEPQPVERDADRIGVLCTFVLQRDRSPSRDELKEAARALRPYLPRVVGIAANFHDADAPQILGPDTLPLDGATRAQDRIGQTYHLASFGSFVQAHREQAARVHQMIVREIGSLDLEGPQTVVPPERARVLDLYGGSGAISIALASANNAVVMVESFAPAANNARTAAESQQIKGLEVRTGDVSEVVASMVDAGEAFDAIVMNPPRRGVSPAAREAVALLGAPIMVYVSCDPMTLARDLRSLRAAGYRPRWVQPIDLMPHTAEVECVAVLER